MGPGFRPEFGCRALPARCIWQGSGFAADQTNAMLAVVRADDESLVPPQEAAGLALSVARPLPAETASLGFGGNPVGGVIKLPVYIFSVLLCGGVVSLPSACASCCRNAGRPRVTVAYLPFLCRHSARPVWTVYPIVGYTRHPIPQTRTQRLTRRNTGRFHRLRHRQGRSFPTAPWQGR